MELLFKNNNLDLESHSVEVQLFQNQPNPFTTSTKIKFQLPHFQDIKLQILDVSGKIIHTFQKQYPEGIHSIDLDQHIFPSPGIYLYKLVTPTFSASKKIIFLR